MEYTEHRNANLGEISQPELDILNSVRNGLRRYYRPEGNDNGEMPFHNIQHAINTEDTVITYIDYVRKNGIEVDEFCLRFAALMHDAGYYEDIDAYYYTPVILKIRNKSDSSGPFRNKEDYSTWLADILAQSYGVEKNKRNKISRLIQCTASTEIPNTIEEKILCRADLDNISGPHLSFFTNTLKLVRESEILSGSDNPIEIMFKLRAILEEYISKDLCFGEFDEEIYNQFFKHPAIANISRITSMNIHYTIKNLGETAFRLLPSLRRNNQS